MKENTEKRGGDSEERKEGRNERGDGRKIEEEKDKGMME